MDFSRVQAWRRLKPLRASLEKVTRCLKKGGSVEYSDLVTILKDADQEEVAPVLMQLAKSGTHKDRLKLVETLARKGVGQSAVLPALLCLMVDTHRGIRDSATIVLSHWTETLKLNVDDHVVALSLVPDADLPQTTLAEVHERLTGLSHGGGNLAKGASRMNVIIERAQEAKAQRRVALMEEGSAAATPTARKRRPAL